MRQRGFTIVELLIVVIVIAILAAIVVITFNGVQQKANNTTTIQSVSSYGRALQAYATQNNGAFPISTVYPCLGPKGSQCANVTDNTGACNGAGATAYDATFDAAIHTVVSSIPGPSSQQIPCNGKQYEGAYYWSADGKTATITYFLANTTDCGSPSGTVVTGTYTFAAGIQCSTNLTH